MIVIPAEKIRKYVTYSVEEERWIHDPEMPMELEPEFQLFSEMAMKYNCLSYDGTDNY
ncbi:hypothetical protein [Butyrivibrio sp.]|uniref:hypothetical protein n=1 Tax=Butyrivibrio sp. TaxID=28121 RepID=UPI0025C69D71|nr:hypothetical protein [Butyrivibrio sp.]